MKKVFILEDLCCANCAAKIEEAVAKLEGVEKASVAFLTQKMVVECDDDKAETLVKEIKKIVKKIEPDVTMIEK